MTTLHDRLADLADEAPAARHDPGLWDRGRRYQRRRRAGTLAIVGVAAALLALLGGVGWQRSAPPVQPATGSVGLPDRIWTPSPWLPGTDRPGRLVAVTVTDRGSLTGMHPGVLGISASTGEYAFLDLPDAERPDLDRPVLSPDGGHLAYWISGETSGTPNTGTDGDPPVTGVAVLDTETGSVTRHWIRTAHGVMPELLAWADAHTVVYSAGQMLGGDDASEMDQSSGHLGRLTSWSLGSDPKPVPGVEAGAGLEGVGHGWVMVDTSSSRAGRRHLLLDLDQLSRSRFVAYPEPSGFVGGMHFVAVDASGERIALVPGRRNPNDVHAGPFGDVREVPGTSSTWGVLDWLDRDTIVTLRRASNWGVDRSSLHRVSVSTGESQVIVRFPTSSFGAGFQFATDLLGAPSVHAEEPPTPFDPRLMAGLALMVAIAAGVALAQWRQHVRP